MSDEKDIAVAVMHLAAGQKSSVCTFQRAYKEIPKILPLSAALTAMSITRPGEPMWHQIVRNIKSHDHAVGNFISEGYLIHVKRIGYMITEKGRKFIAHRT